MVDALKRFVRSRLFKELLAVIAAALSGYASAGCGLVGAKNPEFDVFECQVDAIADAVPRAAAEDLVMAARSGNIEYVVRQLLRLGLAQDDIADIAEAFHACKKPSPDMDAPAPSAPTLSDA